MTHTFKINGNTYEFQNESFSNSRNWGHKSRLYKNNYLIGEGKAIYINRTWEVYQYQSCMKNVVYDLIEEYKQNVIGRYKKLNNIKRLTSIKRDEALKEFKNDHSDLYKLLDKL